MSFTRSVLAAAVGILVATACDQAPTAADLDESASFNQAGGAGPSVTGGGILRFPGTDPNESLTASISVRTRPDGTVDGYFEAHNRTFEPTFSWRVDITCLTVVGNTARVAGEITRSNHPGRPVGSGYTIQLQDNGEGTNSPPDLVRQTFLPAPPETCPVAPAFMFPIAGGNVQVRP